MRVKFLHTADWQLGKPFASVADAEKRVLIQQERLNVLGRIGQVAQERGAEFIVVAGDVFDSPSVTNACVSAACAAIGAMGLPVYVIPGNHDHGGPGSVWEQKFFQRERELLAPNLRVLTEAQPVELEDVVLFPCPLMRRHDSADPTDWLRAVEGELKRFGGKVRVVLAHGSVHDFSGRGDEEREDGERVNRIDLSRLADGVFDYVALGDWHGVKQVGRKAWYSGTPEVDRFPRGPENIPGYVLVVDGVRGEEPVIEQVRTAKLGWHQMAFDFREDADVERLREEVERMIGARTQEDLLLLELSGVLGIEAMNRLDELLTMLESRLLRVKLLNRVEVAPSQSELELLTERAADPLISRVAAKLVAMARNGENADMARLALRELYAACRAS